MPISLQAASEKRDNLNIREIVNVLRDSAVLYGRNPQDFSSAWIEKTREKGLVRVFRLFQSLNYFIAQQNGIEIYEKEILLLFLAMKDFKSGFFEKVIIPKLAQNKLELIAIVEGREGEYSFDYIRERLKATHHLSDDEIQRNIKTYQQTYLAAEFPKGVSAEIIAFFRNSEMETNEDETNAADAGEGQAAAAAAAPAEQKQEYTSAVAQLAFDFLHNILSSRILQRAERDEFNLTDVELFNGMLKHWQDAAKLKLSETDKQAPWHQDNGFFSEAKQHDFDFNKHDSSIIIRVKTLNITNIAKSESKEDKEKALNKILNKIFAAKLPEWAKILLLRSMKNSSAEAAYFFQANLSVTRREILGLERAANPRDTTYDLLLGRILYLTGGTRKFNDRMGYHKTQIASNVFSIWDFAKISLSMEHCFKTLSGDPDKDFRRILGNLLGSIIQVMPEVDVVHSQDLLACALQLKKCCEQILKQQQLEQQVEAVPAAAAAVVQPVAAAAVPVMPSAPEVPLQVEVPSESEQPGAQNASLSEGVVAAESNQSPQPPAFAQQQDGAAAAAAASAAVKVIAQRGLGGGVIPGAAVSANQFQKDLEARLQRLCEEDEGEQILYKPEGGSHQKKQVAVVI